LRVDELGLEVVGQRLESDRAVLACREGSWTLLHPAARASSRTRRSIAVAIPCRRWLFTTTTASIMRLGRCRR
jgi:hypothetical protein